MFEWVNMFPHFLLRIGNTGSLIFWERMIDPLNLLESRLCIPIWLSLLSHSHYHSILKIRLVTGVSCSNTLMILNMPNPASSSALPSSRPSITYSITTNTSWTSATIYCGSSDTKTESSSSSVISIRTTGSGSTTPVIDAISSYSIYVQSIFWCTQLYSTWIPSNRSTICWSTCTCCTRRSSRTNEEATFITRICTITLYRPTSVGVRIITSSSVCCGSCRTRVSVISGLYRRGSILTECCVIICCSIHKPKTIGIELDKSCIPWSSEQIRWSIPSPSSDIHPPPTVSSDITMSSCRVLTGIETYCWCTTPHTYSSWWIRDKCIGFCHSACWYEVLSIGRRSDLFTSRIYKSNFLATRLRCRIAIARLFWDRSIWQIENSENSSYRENQETDEDDEERSELHI